MTLSGPSPQCGIFHTFFLRVPLAIVINVLWVQIRYLNISGLCKQNEKSKLFELIIKWVQNSKQELFVTLNVEWRTGDIKISLRMFVEAPIRQINRSFWPLPLLVSIPTCRNLSTWWTSAGVWNWDLLFGEEINSLIYWIYESLRRKMVF